MNSLKPLVTALLFLGVLATAAVVEARCDGDEDSTRGTVYDPTDGLRQGRSTLE